MLASPVMFSLHMPKSAILQWPSASSSMLSNFKSLLGERRVVTNETISYQTIQDYFVLK